MVEFHSLCFLWLGLRHAKPLHLFEKATHEPLASAERPKTNPASAGWTIDRKTKAPRSEPLGAHGTCGPGNTGGQPSAAAGRLERAARTSRPWASLRRRCKLEKRVKARDRRASHQSLAADRPPPRLSASAIVSRMGRNRPVAGSVETGRFCSPKWSVVRSL